MITHSIENLCTEFIKFEPGRWLRFFERKKFIAHAVGYFANNLTVGVWEKTAGFRGSRSHGELDIFILAIQITMLKINNDRSLIQLFKS